MQINFAILTSASYMSAVKRSTRHASDYCKRIATSGGERETVDDAYYRMTRSERDRGERKREKQREEEEKKSLDKFTILNCKAQHSGMSSVDVNGDRYVSFIHF